MIFFEKNIAIIVAAGKGERMKSHLPKQFLKLNHHPILWHTLKPFLECTDIHHIIVTVPESFINECQNQIIQPLLKQYSLSEKFSVDKDIDCIRGGHQRQESVYLGLKSINHPASIVVIHDGVRPFITSNQISLLIGQAKQKEAVIFGISPRDTIKQVDKNNDITATIDRNKIQMAQTPQAFSYELIMKAHETGRQKNIKATDDAMMVEHMGKKVFVEQGHPLNIKITTPEDLILSKGIFDVWKIIDPFASACQDRQGGQV